MTARLLLVAGALLLILVSFTGDLAFVRTSSTYGNFDAPSPSSFVSRLGPAIGDAAHEKVYRFDHLHPAPLVIIPAVFLVFFLLRRPFEGEKPLGRPLCQWLLFVVTRLGVLRVGGVAPIGRCALGVFPFLNCGACEMATGACPVGMLQAFVQAGRLPLLVMGVMALWGVALGRWVCGWLCPFGYLLDILARANVRRARVPAALGSIKFVALPVVAAAGIALSLFAGGERSPLPFCATLCPSGKIYGVAPYYATTGLAGFLEVAAHPGRHPLEAATFAFHLLVAVALLFSVVFILPRLFCHALCPCGALLALFDRLALVRVAHRADLCRGCGACARECPMGIDLADPRFVVASNCIRCGRCASFCPHGARRWSFGPSGGREGLDGRERKHGEHSAGGGSGNAVSLE